MTAAAIADRVAAAATTPPGPVLPLARMLVNRYLRLAPWDCRFKADLVGAACEAALRARPRYDRTRGAWSTFAGQHMTHAIRRDAARLRALVYVPRDPPDLDAAERARRASVSLSGQASDDEDASHLEPVDSRPGPSELAGVADVRRLVERLLDALPGDQRRAVEAAFGLRAGVWRPSARPLVVEGLRALREEACRRGWNGS